jgi:hypothetical protein
LLGCASPHTKTKAIYREIPVNRWFLEATVGIEPTVRVLQTLALPLGDVAEWRVKYSSGRNHTRITSICQFKNAMRGLYDCSDSAMGCTKREGLAISKNTSFSSHFVNIFPSLAVAQLLRWQAVDE